ncbi:MAG TPA: hypothetical protein VLE43_21650 [Candidatus Saccharimonadia bacterium]|nr:hypothetical protein [Candidatus Saccharimonadia bacterium]
MAHIAPPTNTPDTTENLFAHFFFSSGVVQDRTRHQPMTAITSMPPK